MVDNYDWKRKESDGIFQESFCKAISLTATNRADAQIAIPWLIATRTRPCAAAGAAGICIAHRANVQHLRGIRAK